MSKNELNKNEMMKKLYVLNDIIFFEMFGRKERIEFTEYLVECLLGREVGSLRKKVKIESNYKLKKIKLEDKSLTCDIIVSIPKENLILNIEAYTVFDMNGLEKSVLYINRIHGTQLKKGEKISELKKVEQINIVENVKVNLKKKLKNENYWEEEGRKLTEKEKIEIINLDLLDEVGYNNIENERLLNLLRFIKAKSKEERKEIKERGDRMIKRLYEWLEGFLSKKDNIAIFSVLDFHEQQAQSLGEEIGEKRGRKEGKEEGIKENSIEIAKKMLQTDAPIEYISSITNLPVEKVESLSLKKRV